MTEPEIDEQKQREVQAKSDVHELKVLQALRESDGPLTSSGRLISYGESHTVEISLGLVVLGYVLSGAWLGIHLILAVKALWDHYGKQSRAHPLLEQIAQEIHYYIGTAAAAVLIFEWAGYTPPDLPITFSNVVRVLLGV